MKKLLRSGLNLFMAFIIVVLWLKMALTTSSTAFMAGGFRTLRYFTILSNLLEAFACILLIIKGNEKVKYVAAVSVALTFTVVMVFLGPIFGYPLMFRGSSLCFHGLIPLLSMAEFIFCNKKPMNSKDNLWAVMPMLVYGIGYVGNILINGIPRNDWYGFMRWGYGVGSIIFIVILGVTYLIGLLLRKLNQHFSIGE